MTNKTLPLRPNVCMIVINKEGLLFLGERAGEPGIWQFPQGGVEEGFSLEENVLRELHEELGLEAKSLKIVKKLKSRYEYEFSNPPKYALGKLRGQSQSYWLVAFHGNDSEIDVNRFDRELMSWKWCDIAEVRRLAEPKRLRGYNNALDEVEEYLRCCKG